MPTTSVAASIANRAALAVGRAPGSRKEPFRATVASKVLDMSTNTTELQVRHCNRKSDGAWAFGRLQSYGGTLGRSQHDLLS